MLTPQPPLEMLVDKQAELIVTIVLSCIAVCGVVYALFHWLRSGRPTVLLLLVAGSGMMVFEPMVDTVGGCWFPHNSYILFSAWGRPIPIWASLGYFFYFGIASAMFWMQLRKGTTRRQIWIFFIGAMLGDLVYEYIVLSYDVYIYYGYQPLLVGKFPAWWMAVNAVIPVMLGFAVYLVEKHLQGWRQLGVIPLALTVSAATNAAVGWPSWLVINTDLGWLGTQLGGLASFGMAFALVALVAAFTAAPQKDDSYAAAHAPAVH